MLQAKMIPSGLHASKTSNLTCYPVFQNIKNDLAELYLLLIPDDTHQAVFTNVPITGLKNDRILKNHFFRAVLPNVDAEDRSKLCGREETFL